jgi:hypothetical protein
MISVCLLQRRPYIGGDDIAAYQCPDRSLHEGNVHKPRTVGSIAEIGTWLHVQSV